MRKDRWVIVANSCVARFFRMETIHQLEEVDTLVHTDSRLHGKDITTDKQGRSSDIYGAKHNGTEPTVPPKKQEALVFAKQVSEHLDQIRNNNGVDRIYLAASPSFLGMLRQFLNPQTNHLIELELSKDITHLKPEEIPKYFVF